MNRVNVNFLRLVGVLSMFIEHAAVALNGPVICYVIGRFAFPCFLVMLAVGMDRTRDVKSYASRLLLWGCVSQLPYALLFDYRLNVLFVLGLGVFATLSFTLFCLVMSVSMLALVAELNGVNLIGYGGAGLWVAAFAAASGTALVRGNRALVFVLFVALANGSIGLFAQQPYALLLWAQASALAALVVVGWVSTSSMNVPAWFRGGRVWYAFYPAHLCVLVSAQWVGWALS